VVIVLTGILAGMVAVFIRAPIKAYFDVVNRAELTDIADTALRRAARDIRAALPNSVRIAGTCDGIADCYLEFVPIKSAGRYREALTGGLPAGDILDFNSALDTSFDVLGPGVNIQANDSIVVYNLGIAGSDTDVYTGLNRRAVPAGGVGTGLASVTFTNTAFPIPHASPARRFQVVGRPASYACSGGQLQGNGTGQLQKYSGYAFVATPQPQPPAGTPAALATHVSSCRFLYQPLSQLSALITLELGLTLNSETVSLVYQVHVHNVP